MESAITLSPDLRNLPTSSRVFPYETASTRMSPSIGKVPEFERLYREYGGLAYIMAMRILRDRQLAEDATQESWIRIARELERGVAPRFEQSFVLTITRNEALFGLIGATYGGDGRTTFALPDLRVYLNGPER